MKIYQVLKSGQRKHVANNMRSLKLACKNPQAACQRDSGIKAVSLADSCVFEVHSKNGIQVYEASDKVHKTKGYVNKLAGKKKNGDKTITCVRLTYKHSKQA